MRRPYFVEPNERTFYGYFCNGCPHCKDEENGGGCGRICNKVVFCPAAYESLTLDQLEKKAQEGTHTDGEGALLSKINFCSWICLTYWHFRIREGNLAETSSDFFLEIFLSRWKLRKTEIQEAAIHRQEGSISLPDRDGTKINFQLFQSLADETYWKEEGNLVGISFQNESLPIIIDMVFPIQTSSM